MHETVAAQISAIVIPSFAMTPIIILTAAGSKDEARKIAKSLVESRLAACVNIIARVESIYRWENNVQDAEEWLLLIKTVSANFESIKEAIHKLHSYDLPECISIKIVDSEDGYLKWLTDNVQS
jgi:periplasmic divalent cation tolerance protein